MLISKPIFKGVIPPVSIIVNEKGELDREGTGQVIDYIIDSGVHGLFFLGSGGEFSQMSVEQRKEVAEFAVSYVNGRVPVLIGTGSSVTAEVISLSKHSQEIGAAGVVVINPYYWPLSEKNLFQHTQMLPNLLTCRSCCIISQALPDKTCLQNSF